VHAWGCNCRCGTGPGCVRGAGSADDIPVPFLLSVFSCLHFKDVKDSTRRVEDVRILFFAQLDGEQNKQGSEF